MNIDSFTLTMQQAKRAIKTILNLNGINDLQRVETIYK